MKSISLLIVIFLSFVSPLFATHDIQILEGPHGERKLIIGDKHFPNPTPAAVELDEEHSRHFFDVIDLLAQRNDVKKTRGFYECQPLDFPLDDKDLHVTFRELRKRAHWHGEASSNLVTLEAGDGRNFVIASLLQDFFGAYTKLENFAKHLNVSIYDIKNSDNGDDALTIIKKSIFERDIYQLQAEILSRPTLFLKALEQDILNLEQEVSAFDGPDVAKIFLSQWVETLRKRFEVISQEIEYLTIRNADFNTIDVLFTLSTRDGVETTAQKFTNGLSYAIADLFFLTKALNKTNSVQILVLGSAHAKFVGNYLVKNCGYSGRTLSLNITETEIVSSKKEQIEFLLALTEGLSWVHASSDVDIKLSVCNHCARVKSKTWPRLKNCGQCKTTYYCSTECQKHDWPTHKKVCIKTNL